LNDLANGLLEAGQIGLFPSAKLAGFLLGQVFLLVERGIVNFMSQFVEKTRDLSPPRLAMVGEYSMAPQR
jgi:hypothetical protein